MNWNQYIKEKRLFIMLTFLVISGVVLFLALFDTPVIYNVLLILVGIVPLGIYIVREYFKKRKFYTSLMEGLDVLKDKYLLQTLLTKPNFLEGQMVYETITKTNKSFHEKVNEKEEQVADFTEFIELWVHEIKTPIAASKLIMKNNPVPQELVEEIDHIEAYVEQVLYYARAKEAQKDYIISEVQVEDMVKEVIRKNARSFIYKKIQVDLNQCLGSVYTDKKWVTFIIEQIVSNALKYSKEEQAQIIIYTQDEGNQLILSLEDNGIGMSQKDLKRVFDKGFTGENGRNEKKSTGMGLYLCKQLAQKLYIGLEIESTPLVGTKVHLIFPKNKKILFQE